jgi:hypothetical protein
MNGVFTQSVAQDYPMDLVSVTLRHVHFNERDPKRRWLRIAMFFISLTFQPQNIVSGDRAMKAFE